MKLLILEYVLILLVLFISKYLLSFLNIYDIFNNCLLYFLPKFILYSLISLSSLFKYKFFFSDGTSSISYETFMARTNALYSSFVIVFNFLNFLLYLIHMLFNFFASSLFLYKEKL